jgi:hypothetical protein
MIKPDYWQVDITAFIRELLFGHDCVIVPGFGGFVCNYMPARIDKQEGIFYPPVKQISFNRNLNHNDGLLIGRISGSAGITYGDARNMVDEFVTGVKKRLERGEKVRFDNIGSFINNHEGNIQFEPDRTVNYHLDSYGLEPFNCIPAEGYDVRKRIVRKKNMDPIPQMPSRKVLWRAAVIIPLLSLLVIVPLKTDFFRSKVEISTMNPLVTAEFESNKKALEAASKADSASTEIIIDTVNSDLTNNPAVQAEPIPEKKINSEETPVVKEEATTPVTQEIYSYFVITGSFKSRANANFQADKLKEEGFDPEIINNGNGFFRVCAVSCKSLDIALDKKDSIIKKFPGSWVSRKK